MNNKQKKGFTLIELLIVIGILAILTAAVVLVLNPGELLKQARDSQRMSDLDSLRSAISLFLATVSTSTLNVGPTMTASSTTGNPFSGTFTVTSSTDINGAGWVPVDFSKISGGSPISALPLDPTNDGTYFYAYKGGGSALTFEIDARLESAKYRGSMTKDGGDKNTCSSSYTDDTCFYEIGNDPGLDL